MTLPLEVSASDVKKQLDAGDAIHLIDVREPMENSTAAIAGSELVPMNTVPQRLTWLEDKAESGMLVVYCHHGMRSLMVVNWLREQGIAECVSMAGGIDRWSMEIDPSVPRY